MHRGGWLDEAERIYAEILKVSSGHVEALSLLGVLYRQYGRPEDALRLIDKALAAAPDDPALVGLREEMLDLSEVERRFKQPRWRGEGGVGGRTILLHAGQRLDDTLQFLRYANVVAQQSARVVLEVQEPLRRLTAASFPDMEVRARGETLPPFDLHALLSSLPQTCDAVLKTPWPGPYLEPPVELMGAWARELPSPKKLRIAFVWDHQSVQRPIVPAAPPLSSLEPILSLPQVAFVSLQPELNSHDADILAHHFNVTRLQRPLSDFADIAAVVAQLDGVVAGVEGPIAHLSAAMGKPVLLLLPFGGAWHCPVEGSTDDLWYPSIISYCQHEPGDWSAAVDAVRQELICRAP